MSEKEARAIACERCLTRNHGRCEVCSMHVATEAAHRLARSRLGEWRASNLLMLCRGCHDQQRDGKGGEALATRLGQVLPSMLGGRKPDSAAVKVATAYGVVRLGDDGSISELQP